MSNLAISYPFLLGYSSLDSSPIIICGFTQNLILETEKNIKVQHGNTSINEFGFVWDLEEIHTI